ncbi:hypothetical protein ACFW84_22250 [Streptomyces anulatus]|uniref:hypothetical protein n=1 Tax=Streptomyces anulatus TaxID=1892 RepID=UPI00367C2183
MTENGARAEGRKRSVWRVRSPGGKVSSGAEKLRAGPGRWERVESQAHYFGRDKRFDDFPERISSGRGDAIYGMQNKAPTEKGPVAPGEAFPFRSYMIETLTNKGLS